MKNIIAKPFLKWAGGKSQLLEKFHTMYPCELLNGEIKTYIEPFVGGGAVLLDVLQKFESIEKAYIFDLNKELINCYRCIKSDVEQMISTLKVLKKTFMDLNIDDKLIFYLDIRASFNTIKLNGHYDFEKAAKFIFLTKHVSMVSIE